MTGLWKLLTGIRTHRFSRRETHRISKIIQHRIWEDAARKVSDASDNELTKYIETRAVQLAQPHVDILLRSDPTLTSDFASRLMLHVSQLSLKLAWREIERVKVRSASSSR